MDKLTEDQLGNLSGLVESRLDWLCYTDDNEQFHRWLMLSVRINQAMGYEY